MSEADQATLKELNYEIKVLKDEIQGYKADLTPAQILDRENFFNPLNAQLATLLASKERLESKASALAHQGSQEEQEERIGRVCAQAIRIEMTQLFAVSKGASEASVDWCDRILSIALEEQLTVEEDLRLEFDQFKERTTTLLSNFVEAVYGFVDKREDKVQEEFEKFYSQFVSPVSLDTTTNYKKRETHTKLGNVLINKILTEIAVNGIPDGSLLHNDIALQVFELKNQDLTLHDDQGGDAKKGCAQLAIYTKSDAEYLYKTHGIVFEYVYNVLTNGHTWVAVIANCEIDSRSKELMFRWYRTKAVQIDWAMEADREKQLCKVLELLFYVWKRSKINLEDLKLHSMTKTFARTIIKDKKSGGGSSGRDSRGNEKPPSDHDHDSKVSTTNTRSKNSSSSGGAKFSANADTKTKRAPLTTLNLNTANSRNNVSKARTLGEMLKARYEPMFLKRTEVFTVSVSELIDDE